MRKLLLTALLGAALAAASPASGNDLFTLDQHPTSPGHVVEDVAGNAYVTWTRKSTSSAPDPVMFCKIAPGGTCAAPKELPIPGAVDATDVVAGVFPVLGTGTTVYVVAPRYVADDVVIWESTDGGQTFGAPVVAAEHTGYSNKSEPTNVILAQGGLFLIGAFNPGLGFSGEPTTGIGGEHLDFASVAGTVGTGSLALTGSKTLVQAYWSLSDPNSMSFYRYKGLGNATLEASWEGPLAIGNGYETKLAGGSGGIYLASQDYAGGSTPSAVNVRKFAGTAFGAPVTLATDSNVDLFAGGAIAQSPNGRVAVAWPGTRGTDQAKVMRLFASTDGGASFAETDVAHVGGAYSINDNAQLAVGDSGAGWLTFVDEGGLKVADLNPVAPAEPPTYKGVEKTIGTKVGDFELTLRLPKSCLQPAQSFYAGAGKRVRHKVAKAVHSKLTLKKATFFFDGKKLKTLKKKPLKLLISPGPLAAGSVHQVKVKVTAIARKNGKNKKVVRTLKGTITIC